MRGAMGPRGHGALGVVGSHGVFWGHGEIELWDRGTGRSTRGAMGAMGAWVRGSRGMGPHSCASFNGMRGYRGMGPAPNRRCPFRCPCFDAPHPAGRAMAEAVRGKRTPIGAFANHDLAKANK